MVRILPLVLLPGLLLGLGLALGACDKYKEPIAFAPHGEAVRNNMAAMIIDPTPSTAAPGPMDSERAVLALERYRANEVEALGNVSTAPTVVVAPSQ